MDILEVVEACNAGVGRHVRSLCEDLAAQDHRLTVAFSPYRTDRAFEQFIVDWRNRVRFTPIKVGREVSPLSDLRGLVELLSLMKRGGPFDVVHAHSSKAGAIARVAGRLLGIPTLYTPHSLILSSPQISRLEATVYASVERALGHGVSSKVIALSEGEREFILEHRLVPRNRVAVIPNAIEDGDLRGFTEGNTREDLSQRPLTFGAAMRFSAQKAPANLVEAFASLSEALPQIPMQLAIAGDGELFSDVERQIEKEGLSGKVSLLGWTPNIKGVLRELDVFVLPSLYEGFSYSILEAMAAGLPIVSTDVFGTEETVSRVPGNAVVPAGSPDALAVGMRRMATLDKPESLRMALRRIGRDNYEYVRMHFRQGDITRRILEVYREVGGKRSSRKNRA